MDLNNIIALCKTKDAEVIEGFKEEHKRTIDQIKISEIVEIPFKGNYNLDMVFSLNKKQPATFFLLKAIDVLEFEASEELIFYNFEDYSFDNLVDELSFQETKDRSRSDDVVSRVATSVNRCRTHTIRYPDKAYFSKGLIRARGMAQTYF